MQSVIENIDLPALFQRRCTWQTVICVGPHERSHNEPVHLQHTSGIIFRLVQDRPHCARGVGSFHVHVRNHMPKWQNQASHSLEIEEITMFGAYGKNMKTKMSSQVVIRQNYMNYTRTLLLHCISAAFCLTAVSNIEDREKNCKVQPVCYKQSVF